MAVSHDLTCQQFIHENIPVGGRECARGGRGKKGEMKGRREGRRGGGRDEGKEGGMKERREG